MRNEDSRGKYIYSSRHGFVYFVNQKVACSSIKLALLPAFGFDDEFVDRYRHTDKHGRDKLRIHRLFDESGAQVHKQDLLKPWNVSLRKAFKFGFVRNPWDRLVSCYKQKIQYRSGSDRGKETPLRAPAGMGGAFKVKMPFREFVEAVHAIPDSQADPHFRSQSAVFYSDEPEPRCLADFVGRFENLGSDFRHVVERIGLAGQVELPHVLKSPATAPDYREYYDAHTRELVAERFAADIRHFDYQF